LAESGSGTHKKPTVLRTSFPPLNIQGLAASHSWAYQKTDEFTAAKIALTNAAEMHTFQAQHLNFQVKALTDLIFPAKDNEPHLNRHLHSFPLGLFLAEIPHCNA
jgi:hypothetical protein